MAWRWREGLCALVALSWASRAGASAFRAGRPGGNSSAAAGSQGDAAEGDPPRSAESFAAFVALHGRQYRPGSAEYRRRQALFEKRAGEVAWQNARPSRIWTAGVNHLSDWTEEELQQLRGNRPGAAATGGSPAGARISALSATKRRGSVGPSKDWRHLPVLQKPRNQGSCGSCWAIAAATLVQAYAQKGNLANASKPSVQQLVSCVLNPDKCGGDGGCKGATIGLALNYALLHGPRGEIFSEAEWPYQPGMIIRPPGYALQCPTSTTTTTTTVAIPFSSYLLLPSNEYTPFLEALYETGPVGVSVAAGKWFNYQSGIFDSCTGSAGAVVDHAVVAVAFGEQAGTKYWTLMNSWGYNWGENGYIRLLRRDDDSSHCAQNHQPELGTACKPYPAQQTVCGMCGILFENVVLSP